MDGVRENMDQQARIAELEGRLARQSVELGVMREVRNHKNAQRAAELSAQYATRETLLDKIGCGLLKACVKLRLIRLAPDPKRPEQKTGTDWKSVTCDPPTEDDLDRRGRVMIWHDYYGAMLVTLQNLDRYRAHAIAWTRTPKGPEGTK